MAKTRTIAGLRYTQAARRAQSVDIEDALRSTEPLMHLWRLGYDVSGARVVSR